MEKQAGLCIIGVGNEYRSDDGVGPWVARHIAARAWPGVQSIALDTQDGAALLSAWAGYDTVYVVDAVSAAAPAGTILRLTGRQLRSASATAAGGAHGLSIQQAVALGDILHLTPRSLTVYGIVGQTFAYGSALSPEAVMAAQQLVGRLRRTAARRGHADA